MNNKVGPPQKGFSAWFLKLIGLPLTNTNVLYVRLGIVVLCAAGILLLNNGEDRADKYGNQEEMMEKYPELFE